MWRGVFETRGRKYPSAKALLTKSSCNLDCRSRSPSRAPSTCLRSVLSSKISPPINAQTCQSSQGVPPSPTRTHRKLPQPQSHRYRQQNDGDHISRCSVFEGTYPPYTPLQKRDHARKAAFSLFSFKKRTQLTVKHHDIRPKKNIVGSHSSSSQRRPRRRLS